MFKKIREDWEMLNRPIYTGERLRENLHALTVVSIFTAMLGLVLMIVDLVTGDKAMFATAFLTFLGGVGCGYFAGVQKNRERAALIPTLFCIFAFTFYTINGLGEGSAMLWSLMAPIGLCYFVSVRNGIFVSLYYTVFFFVIFYTPLREHMRPYYTDAFLTRFPILYASMTAFVVISMTQYHRGILLENEYAEKLSEEVARQTEVAETRAKKIEQMSFQTIQTLASAIDAKDPYTKGHSTRVSQYSVLIAKALNWDAERVNDLRYAAMLHDIGKIGVPDSILNNPKRLTDMEYNIIKSHTVMGGDILKDRIMIKSAEDVARSHHERYDGRGYPRGLKGEEISEEARIAAIADAFDAMSSNRVYRNACDYDHIRNELVNGKGRQFDPRFTDVFIGLWDRGMLDDILQQSTTDDDGSIEASGLLREVMDTILSQNVEETDILTGLMNRGAGEAAIAHRMREQGGGRIVCMSSVAAPIAIPFQAYYSASKAAVRTYCLALHEEVRPYGVEICVIMPGDIATGFTAARAKSAEGDDVYGGRISRSVAVMEHDEQTGMTAEFAGSFVAKIATKKGHKPVVTMGGKYKVFVFLTRLLSTRLMTFLVGKIYAS